LIQNVVIPGLIDLKIHGAMGYDANGKGLAEIIKILPVSWDYIFMEEH